MARFTELGFPTTKHEEWKYTSVLPIVRTRFQRPAAGGRRPATGAELPSLVSRLSPFACRLVFLNGRYVPDLSSTDALARSITVRTVASACDRHF